MQPWQVEEVWQRLKTDMREYRKATTAKQDTAPLQVAILFDAGWQGHYVGDGSQPLHMTIQYNGWQAGTPNPKGLTTEHKIHSQFESVYVTANIKRDDVAALVTASKPKQFDDEWTQYLDYIHRSNSLVEKVYELEKAGGFTGAGTPEAKAFTAGATGRRRDRTAGFDLLGLGSLGRSGGGVQRTAVGTRPPPPSFFC